MAEGDDDIRARPKPPMPPGFSNRPSGMAYGAGASAPTPPSAPGAAARPPAGPYSSPVSSPPPSAGGVAAPPWVSREALKQPAPPVSPVSGSSSSYAGQQQYGGGAPQPPRPPMAQASAASAPRYQSLELQKPSALPLGVAAVALILAMAALFLAWDANSKLVGIKVEAKALAQDVKTLGDKRITLSAPVRTTTGINKTIPLGSLLASTFSIPLDFQIPVNTTLVAIGSNGQPTTFAVKDSVNIRADIPVDTEKAMAGQYLTISETIPVDTQLTTNVTLSTLYGTEIADIANRLERIGG